MAIRFAEETLAGIVIMKIKIRNVGKNVHYTIGKLRSVIGHLQLHRSDSN